jgi:hypothetical protein
MSSRACFSTSASASPGRAVQPVRMTAKAMRVSFLGKLAGGACALPAFFRFERCLLLVVLMSLALVSKASAHSFYPWECCSSQDCWPMGSDTDALEPEPVPTGGGWKLFDGTIIPYEHARPSPDGRFHVCRRNAARNGQVIVPNTARNQPAKPPCLWAPVNGM